MLIRFDRSPLFASPFGEIPSFEREIDRLFDGVLGDPFRPAGAAAPRFDVAEHENETVVIGELPGVKKDEVKIAVQDGVLTVSGERKAPALPENASWVRTEMPHGAFSRSFALPHQVEEDRIDATLTDGVLRIVLPKAAEARPRSIAIR
jgi:HSP20 family protein